MRSLYIDAGEPAAIHIYQKTPKGFLVFYSVKDHVVFFMTLCLMARKYGIKVLGISIMPDHFHLLILPVPMDILSLFMQESTRCFARSYNSWYGRTGQLFNHSYGKSLKRGEKKMRTAAAYVYNNPVEKRLCQRAELYQWNFLAYANQSYPFSDNQPLRKTRKALRAALSVIQSHIDSGKIIPYALLESLSESLTPEEVRVWIDTIIHTYNCVDYKALISLYGSYEMMLMAFESNTGSEYDIKEDFTPGSDRIYAKMTQILNREYGKADIREVLSMPLEKRRMIGRTLLLKTKATPRQVIKYLQLE